jgi:hypothetical protein
MQWSDLPRNPSRSTLRQFAALSLGVFGVAAWRCHANGQPELAWAFGTLAVGLGLPGLVYPRCLRVVFVGWLMAVFPIGFVVSRVVLAGLFYGCFTPLGVAFRLLGRDALGLKRASTGETYWRARPATADPARYLQPF